MLIHIYIVGLIDNAYIHIYTVGLIDNAYIHIYTVGLIDNAYIHIYTVGLIDNAYIHIYTVGLIDNAYIQMNKNVLKKKIRKQDCTHVDHTAWIPLYHIKTIHTNPAQELIIPLKHLNNAR